MGCRRNEIVTIVTAPKGLLRVLCRKDDPPLLTASSDVGSSITRRSDRGGGRRCGDRWRLGTGQQRKSAAGLRKDRACRELSAHSKKEGISGRGGEGRRRREFGYKGEEGSLEHQKLLFPFDVLLLKPPPPPPPPPPPQEALISFLPSSQAQTQTRKRGGPF